MPTAPSVAISFADAAEVTHDLGTFYCSTKPNTAGFDEDVDGAAWFVAYHLHLLYSDSSAWLASESLLIAAVVDALKDIRKEPEFAGAVNDYYMTRYNQLAAAAKVDPAALMPDGRPYIQLAPTLQLFSLRSGYVYEDGEDPVLVRFEVPFSGLTPAMPPPTPRLPDLPQDQPILFPPAPPPEAPEEEPTPEEPPAP